MANIVFYIGCLCVTFFALSSAHDGDSISEHLERLEVQMARADEKHMLEIEVLKESMRLREADLIQIIKTLDTRVNSLEIKNEALVRRIFWLQTKTTEHALRKPREDEADRSAGNTRAARDVISATDKDRKNSGKIRSRSTDTVNLRQALQSQFNVAFTAYIDHDANGLGNGQTLVFNQVLLNDGNCYSKYTGIFTAPISGVYSFTYVLGQRDKNQLWTALYVNNKNQVGAAVETEATALDAQSGNSAVLKLAAGDAVYVHTYSGSHAEGSDKNRLTTFSGFLLYPTQTAVVG